MKAKTNKLVENGKGDGGADTDAREKKKSNKGKQEKLGLKKEAKQKRLQSLSEGLGFDFSTTENVKVEEMNRYADLNAEQEDGSMIEDSATSNGIENTDKLENGTKKKQKRKHKDIDVSKNSIKKCKIK